MSKHSINHDSPINGLASDQKSSTWCKESLEDILKFIGLLVPINASFWHNIRALPVLILAVLALIYEVFREVLYFMNNQSANLKLVDYIQVMQYTFKAISTLLILIIFWRKSSSIIRFTNKLDELQEESEIHITEVKREKIKSENRVAGFFLLTFVIYMVSMIGIRVADVLSSAPLQGPWSAASPPWDAFHMTVLDENVFILLTWTLTNAVKLLCSGYLAVLLFSFGKGSAAHCRLHLACILRNGDDVAAVKMNINHAWNLREEALTMAKFIQSELGILLGFIMFADIMSVNSILASFLSKGRVFLYLNYGLSTIFHLVSTSGIAIGLIHLMDEVSPEGPQKRDSSSRVFFR
jgi:hypothetical protein